MRPGEKGRGGILLCLPVIILPVSNLLCVAITHMTPVPTIPVLIGAVVEELFYRWILLKNVLLKEEKISPTLSVILVSIVFALMHLWNLRIGTAISSVLLQVFCAFFFSIWAGAVVWKSTILIPILTHVLLNLTAVDSMAMIPLIASVIVLLDGGNILLNNR